MYVKGTDGNYEGDPPKIILILEKIGSMIIDRRLLVAIMAVVALLRMLGVMQNEFDETAVEQSLQTGAAFVFALANLLAILVPLYTVVKSWEIRPPSGLDFQILRFKD